MTTNIVPGVTTAGKLFSNRDTVKQNLTEDLNFGRKNIRHYSNSNIADGSTNARTALAAADAEGPVVLPPGTYAIASNITLTNNVLLEPGAKLKPANGVTVTLSGGYTALPNQYVFDLSAGGTVAVPSPQYNHAGVKILVTLTGSTEPDAFFAPASDITSPTQWATALHAAAAYIGSVGGKIELPPNTYIEGQEFEFIPTTGNVEIYGNGSKIQAVANYDWIVYAAPVAGLVVIKDLIVDGGDVSSPPITADAKRHDGIHIVSVSEEASVIERCEVRELPAKSGNSNFYIHCKSAIVKDCVAQNPGYACYNSIVTGGTAVFERCESLIYIDKEGINSGKNRFFGVAGNSGGSVTLSNCIWRSTVGNTHAIFDPNGSDEIDALVIDGLQVEQTGIRYRGPFAFTATHGTDTINCTDHRLLNGEVIQLTGADLPNGLTAATDYYVINRTANTFQLSLTEGGAAVTFSDNGSGSMTWFAATGLADPQETYVLKTEAIRKVTLRNIFSTSDANSNLFFDLVIAGMDTNPLLENEVLIEDCSFGGWINPGSNLPNLTVKNTRIGVGRETYGIYTGINNGDYLKTITLENVRIHNLTGDTAIRAYAGGPNTTTLKIYSNNLHCRGNSASAQYLFDQWPQRVGQFVPKGVLEIENAGAGDMFLANTNIARLLCDGIDDNTVYFDESKDVWVGTAANTVLAPPFSSLTGSSGKVIRNKQYPNTTYTDDNDNPVVSWKWVSATSTWVATEHINTTRKNALRYSTDDIADGTTDARAAILTADADGPVVLAPGTYAIASNLTLSNNVKFEPGAKIKPASGVTVTLSGGYSAEDTQHVFDLSAGGSVVVAKRSYVTPQHFGTGQAGFKAAAAVAIAAAVPLEFPGTSYSLSDLSSAFNVTGNLTIRGAGEKSLITGPNLTTHLLEVGNTSGASLVLENLNFSTFQTVANFQGNSANDAYTLTIRNCKADNFGWGFVGSGAGVYCKYSGISVDNLNLTDMGKTVAATKATGIDLSIVECPSTIINNVNIDGVGSGSHSGTVGGIMVDCSQSTDKAQSVLISNCVVKNVNSGASAAQSFGIMSLEASAAITHCFLDTIVGAAASNPEGIYTKGSNCRVSNNILLDVMGKEGCINMKGAGEATPSKNSIVENNLISFRSGMPSETCRGIYAYDVNMSIRNNRIIGCAQAIVGFCEGLEITGNTFSGIKNVSGSTCAVIEIQPTDVPNIPITFIRITDNVFENCGLVGNTNTYGVLYTQAGTLNVGSVDVSNNTFVNNLGTATFGLRLLHTGTGYIDSVIYSGNVNDGTTYGLNIGTTGVEEINNIEFSNNTGYGSSDVYFYSSNAVSTGVVVKGNFLDGKPWGGDNGTSQKFADDFGAKGDGVTDAKAAIEAADTARTGVITLPAGTYYIATNLTITNLVRFEPGAKIKPANGVTVALNGGYEAVKFENPFDTSLGGSITVGKELENLGSLGSGTQAFNFNNGNGVVKKVTATGNIALQFNATIPGSYKAIIEMDGTGGHTITYSTTVKGTAPTINTTASEKTLIPLFFDGTTWFHA